MTRFARGGPANKKKPNEASSWQELKKSSSKSQASEGSAGHSGGPSKTSTSARPRTDGSVHKKMPRTDPKSDAFKKMGKEILLSASSAKSASVHVPTKAKHKNKKKMSNFRKSQRKETETVDEPVDNAKYVQNSKSLIEELEEMDRQQMAEISKEELTQQRGATNSEEQNQQMEKKSSGPLDKKERRREERRLKRQKAKTNKMVCYHCREPGHGVADCPKALADAEQGTGVCYRCGSTEHDSSQCTARIDPNQGEFPFAKCFICQEMGHLSKSCPDNPKGLYPMGGCCKYCESVEHMSWNCPHNKKVKGAKEIHISLYSETSHQSADAEVFEPRKRPAATIKKKTKIVKF